MNGWNFSFGDSGLPFSCLGWLDSLFSTFQLVFSLPRLTALMILIIPACLFLALVDRFDDFEDSSLSFLLLRWLFSLFSSFQLAFLTYSGDWILNFQFSSYFVSAFSMTVFNPPPKRYQKISLVQIDTKKSLINPNKFIAENDVPLQQITFPCVYLNVTSSNFAHPNLLPGHRLLIMSQK